MSLSLWRSWRKSWSQPASSERRNSVLQLEPLEPRLLPSSLPQPLGVTPQGPFTSVGALTFFAAPDGTHLEQLWKSDGTRAGTMKVTDIAAFGGRGSYPQYLTNVNGTLFFAAVNDTDTTQLYRSDGTAGGTKLVSDIYPFPGNHFLTHLTNVSGTLFFSDSDGLDNQLHQHGEELWRSDGTSGGTHLVADINPGNFSSYPYDLTNVNGTVFFGAKDTTNHFQLYKSDGTQAGTTRVGVIDPNGDAKLHYLTNVNGTLFFEASNGTGGLELWRTTSRGVEPLGPKASAAAFLCNVNGTLFFQANDGTHGSQLWRSDGTAGGTQMVKDINTNSTFRKGNSYPYLLTNVKGTLFFRATEGVDGSELWRSDGTNAGTVLVKDVRQGSFGSYPYGLVNVSGTLFFEANDAIHGYELWQSDGTNGGTQLVMDIYPGKMGSYPHYLTNGNGTLFFNANSGTEEQAYALGVGLPTSVKATFSPSPVMYGQKVEFSATVQTGGNGTPSGMVTFMDGDTPLGSAALNGTGNATFSTASLSVGAHTITAAYSGDPRFAGSATDIPLTVDPANFAAISDFSQPPDTMGAIGPNDFMEVLNSNIAIFTRGGESERTLGLDTFFAIDVNGVQYPRNGTTDPRVLYDRQSGRWFASILELGPVKFHDNDIILAVSQTSDPKGMWYKYVLRVGEADGLLTYDTTDFDTLGVDSQGVYLGMELFTVNRQTGLTVGDQGKIVAIPKQDVLSGSLNPTLVQAFYPDHMDFAQPATNVDTQATGSSPEFFVSTTPSKSIFGSASPALLSSSALYYCDVFWKGKIALVSQTVTVTVPSYRQPINAPAKGSTFPILTDDARLQMAVMTNGHLWTAGNIGTTSGGGNAFIDRTGIQWFEFNATGSSETTVNFSLVQSGRVYDTATSDPMSYYYPSLMVNGPGTMQMAFSGSSATQYVGVYATEREPKDPAGTTQPVRQLQAGLEAFNVPNATKPYRWGDYSYTSLDPLDNMTMWTVQEYAPNPTIIDFGQWATRVIQLTAPAPTLDNPKGSAHLGQTVTLTLSGTGFYDPGSSFSNDHRLRVQLFGGNPNGISNPVVVFKDATSATVTFTVAANASPGSRDVVLTNPDGQTAPTVSGGFTVLGDSGADSTILATAGPPRALPISDVRSAETIPVSASSASTTPFASTSLDDARPVDLVNNLPSVYDDAKVPVEALRREVAVGAAALVRPRRVRGSWDRLTADLDQFFADLT
jgi:ELWxxDGT repeat protein